MSQLVVSARYDLARSTVRSKYRTTWKSSLPPASRGYFTRQAVSVSRLQGLTKVRPVRYPSGRRQAPVRKGFPNPVTGCLFIEPRDPAEILSLLSFSGARGCGL